MKSAGLTVLLLWICSTAAWAAPAPNAGTQNADPEGLYAEDQSEGDTPSDLPGYSMDGLKRLADSLQRTGVGTDQIPALYRPQFLTISDASLSMEDDEVVFVVHYPQGRVRIYPQRLMVWHEAVNDVLPDAAGNLPPPGRLGSAEAEGQSYTIAYSPLTGSVSAFRSMAGKYPSTFGVTGNLINGNSVLYDRISGSLWAQLPAVCVEGPFKGRRLDRIPVLWARWGGVKERYAGKAEVLSRSTGYKRPYGKDPYGSYQLKGTYYDDVRLLFAISRLDHRLPPKKRILGVEHEAMFGAVIVDEVREQKILNFSLGVIPLVAFYDTQLGAVRIFDRRLDDPNHPLEFAIFEDNYVDKQSKSQWTPDGQGTYGRYRDRQLKPLLAVDAMWYAWAAFFPGTRIFPFNEWEQLNKPSGSLPTVSGGPMR